MQRIAILGAGPMGLSLAHFLRSYAHCTVFEAASEPGGMSVSFDFDGITIEKYYHFINTPDEHFFTLLDELGMKQDLRWHPTKMGFYRYGALHPWGTPQALLQLHDIPLITRLRYGLHAYRCKFLDDLAPLDDISAADWIQRWEGTAGYDLFWRFLFEKKFFDLADPLSAAWIASRIRRVANSRESLTQEKLGYLEGGSFAFINRLIEDLKNNGGALRLSTPVTEIEPDGSSGGIVRHAQGEERFDAIFSTLPLPYLPTLAPSLPKPWLDKIRQIKNIGCVCILFRLAKPLTENFWVNIDMPDWDIPGIIEYSNLRPMKKAYVYVPFYMPQTHPNWTLGDESILAKARTCLKAINAEAANTEEAVRIFRYEYAQPVCPPGFRHILPSYETGARGIFAADTSHSFPEDRSINESVRIAAELAKLAEKSL